MNEDDGGYAWWIVCFDFDCCFVAEVRHCARFQEGCWRVKFPTTARLILNPNDA